MIRNIQRGDYINSTVLGSEREDSSQARRRKKKQWLQSWLTKSLVSNSVCVCMCVYQNNIGK